METQLRKATIHHLKQDKVKNYNFCNWKQFHLKLNKVSYLQSLLKKYIYIKVKNYSPELSVL